jgi:predicted CXXCH cytochrome family protein
VAVSGPRWCVLLALLAGAAACGPKRVYTALPAAEVAGVKDPHRFRGGALCQGCHAAGTAALQRDAIDLCAGCHAQAHGDHPLRLAPRRPPEGLPLWQGQIACHTCHDPHAVGARAGHGLRLPGDALCRRCHDK